MSRLVELVDSRRLPAMAVLALVSAAFAGCSADTSRFSDNPFANPFNSRNSAVASTAQPAPVQRVESQPLPSQYGSRPGSYPSASYPSVETTGAIPHQQTQSPVYGLPIIVGTSDTIDTLARRYNVSAAEIMSANRLSSPRAIQPGQRLVIPRRAPATGSHTQKVSSAPAVAAPAVAAPQTRPVRVAGQQKIHVVTRGETVMALSRRYHVKVADLAAANRFPARGHRLKIGEKVIIPGHRQHVAAAARPAPIKYATATAVVAKPAAERPLPKAHVVTPTVPVPVLAKSTDATGGLASFRWPVRGRVIVGYGARTNGKQNDGINVSVPEGTPIKAAEDGVVAYAGNELKGYGNLVLVRHANGYVTAYAHASELAVRRGDHVKRGQMLGRAGQTGDVNAPQVHFEIRKGSTPVDPTQFLSGA